METQKIVNLLNSSENQYSKFATKKYYVIESETKGGYSHKNLIKFLTSSIESCLCDYIDAYVLVTGNIAVTRTTAGSLARTQLRRKQEIAATQVAFKSCAPFKKCRTVILQCLCII